MVPPLPGQTHSCQRQPYGTRCLTLVRKARFGGHRATEAPHSLGGGPWPPLRILFCRARPIRGPDGPTRRQHAHFADRLRKPRREGSAPRRARRARHGRGARPAGPASPLHHVPYRPPGRGHGRHAGGALPERDDDRPAARVLGPRGLRRSLRRHAELQQGLATPRYPVCGGDGVRRSERRVRSPVHPCRRTRRRGAAIPVRSGDAIPGPASIARLPAAEAAPGADGPGQADIGQGPAAVDEAARAAEEAAEEGDEAGGADKIVTLDRFRKK